jgi:hypothetical protein
MSKSEHHKNWIHGQEPKDFITLGAICEEGVTKNKIINTKIMVAEV